MLFVEITAILIAILATLSIVRSTHKVGISPVPSTRRARQVILAAVADRITGDGPIVDLGSGWGHLALAAARRFPERRIIGYELSPIPWCVSILLKKILGRHNLVFYRRDYLKADLPGAAAFLCYLFPGGMQALEEKLAREKKQVRLIVSNTFALPRVAPDELIRLKDIYRTPIYIYHKSIASMTQSL